LYGKIFNLPIHDYKIQENKGYFIEDETIIINRGLTILDLFVKDFLNYMSQLLNNH